MERLAKAFLVLTSVFYTVFLFYVYAYFADQTSIYLQLYNQVISFTNNALFYTGIIIPSLVIIGCYVLAGIIDKQPLGSSHFIKQAKVKTQLCSWSISFAAVFNLFASAILSIILFSNNEEGVTRNGFAPFLIVGVALLVVWVLWLPIILLRNK